MSVYRQELERLIAETESTAEDRMVAEEAGQILVEMIRLEGRAARLLSSRPRIDATPPARSLAGLTLHEAAEEVLREAGTPLHVQNLGNGIKARGWRHPRSKRAREDQINFQLAARLPRLPQFRRVAPNTFALSEWGLAGPERPKPQLGLFAGGGKVTGRQIDESQEHVEAPEWRSS